jgi:hypothetical protein
VLDGYTPLAYSAAVVFLETSAFTARIERLLGDEAYRALQAHLVRQPTSGDVIAGTGGLRKLRWGTQGRGKRGGIRVIYFWHPISRRMLMLFAFAKNEASDLTAEQRRVLRRIVEAEYP